MIQILPCAKCGRHCVLPLGVSLEASIECPGCQEQFVVGEMLTSHLGTWTVLEDPAAAASASEVVDDEQASSAALEGELKLADTDTEQPAKPKVNWAEFKPITHEQFERMKRKSRSPIWPMLQVVLGGLAAVPIALLLLWHLLDRDIGGAGPFVGQYLPWIVPEKYRPADSDAPSQEDQRRPPPPQRGDSGFRRFDDVISADGEPEPGLDGQETQPSNAGGELPSRQDSMPGEPTEEMPSQGAPSQSTESPRPPSPATDDQGLESSGESEPPSSGAQNIFVLIRQCEQNLDRWHAAVRAEDSDLKPLAKNIYSGLLDLAVTIGELPEGQPVLRTIRDSMQPIGRTIKQHPDVQSVVQQGAKYWSEQYEDQQHHPLAIIVELEEVVEDGSAWRLTPNVETGFEGGETEVRVPRYLAPTLIPGQRLLLLGKVEWVEKNPEPTAPSGRVFTACYLHAM